MKLTQFYADDIPIIQQWLQNKSLMYYMATEKSSSSLPISFAIRNGPALIGWANLFNIEIDNKKAEFGMAIPNQKHTRLGGIATIQVLKYAFGMIDIPGFDKLNLNRVYVRPLASNVLPDENDMRERFGFVREGAERQAVKRGEIYEDVIVMSILKNEFIERWG